MNTAYVGIHAGDGITHAGLSRYVDQHQQLQLVPVESADVVVVAVESVDDATAGLLGALPTGDRAKIVLVTGGDWQLDPKTAATYQVRAVLTRDGLNAANMAKAVLAVALGQALLPPTVQGRLLDQFEHVQRRVLAPLGLDMSGFTDREVSVLRLMSEGRDLAEIATALNYSERTIKKILSAVLNRFELRNRTHAVSYAIRLGLI